MIYNDYYLLYLISLHEEPAFDILYHKYIPLIKRCIAELGLNNFEDAENYLMVADQMFVKAVETYNPDLYLKTFTRYFEMILKRRFNYLRIHEKQKQAIMVNYDENIPSFYNLAENDEEIVEDYDEDKCFSEALENYLTPDEREFVELCLSNLEKKIFVSVKLGHSAKVIAQSLSLKPKQVYNAIQRIKIKREEYNLNTKY